MVTRFSNSFIPTKKEAPKDAVSLNQKLLARGGFIHQELAGVYTFLPIGLRVLRKVENIIRKHMDALGGQELLMPALEPKANWVKSGRWDSVDILFKVPSQHGFEYALGPTHEEIVIPLAKEKIKSYKDMPFSVYQIQTKFRDEPRAKSGLIRGREFGMKDLYSFHATKEDLEAFYEKVKKTYIALFEEMGLEVKVTEASGGDFTKKFSHEFMVLSDAGEDKILACTHCHFAQNQEIAKVQVGDSCPECEGKIEEHKAVEAGNIFDLSTKFSEDFDLKFTTKDGKEAHPFVGCYGIGTSRIVGTIAEVHADDKGLVWTDAVTPYDIHIVVLDTEDASVTKQLEDVLAHAQNKGMDVLVDDRDESAGTKFADADVIGIPQRVIVSRKTAKEGKLELKRRTEEKVEMVKIADLA